jgi:hypothetical protein
MVMMEAFLAGDGFIEFVDEGAGLLRLSFEVSPFPMN